MRGGRETGGMQGRKEGGGKEYESNLERVRNAIRKGKQKERQETKVGEEGEEVDKESGEFRKSGRSRKREHTAAVRTMGRDGKKRCLFEGDVVLKGG